MVTRPCVAGCGAEVEAIELFGSVFPRFCEPCRLASEAEDAKRERAERVAELLGRVRIGGLVKGWSAETYPADARGRKAMEEGRAWLEGFRAGQKSGLLIFGPVGGGKTGLAWSLVRELIEVDLVEAQMVNFRDWLAEVRASFGRNGPRLAVPAPMRTPVLFLDDLGAERPTDFARDELATLVEWRYQRRLPTGATSNYEPGALAERLGHDDPIVGQRIVSRLADGAAQIRVAGKDRRL